MEKTVLLNFEIDQSKAIRDYEKLEKVIMDNKTAQQELTKALKAGNITQEEYISEQARLSQNLSKETQQRNTLKKVIEAETGSVNAEKAALAQLVQQRNALNKTTDEGLKKFNAFNVQIKQLTDSLKKGEQAGGNFGRNVGNYTNSVKDAAAQMNIAGVNVGGLSTQLSSFANPAAAAVGIVGALGAAYARSTVGAKDLSFAQNQLSEATTIVTNKLAGLISSAEDGDGAITKLLNLAAVALSQTSFGSALGAIGLDPVSIANESKELALVTEQLEDLGRLEAEIRTNASQRLEQNQELLEKIADDQQSINDRSQAANTIEQNLLVNKKNILDVLNSELAILQKQSAADPNNEAKQDLVLAKRRAIAQESASLEKQLTKINKVQDDLNAKLGIELKLQQDISREKGAPNTKLVEKATGNQLSDPAIQASEIRIQQSIKELAAVNFTEKQKQEFYRQSATIKQELDQQTFQATANIIGQAAGIFNEQTAAFKVLASAQTLMTTYSAAEKTYDALAGIPYVGPYLGAAAAAVAVADGLARVAQINGVQFAEGGYTGDGHKYQPAGIVHAGEVVWNQRDVAAVGGPSAADRMRPSYSGSVSRGTYANGGIVTSAVTRAADQQMLMMNAIKNLPVPEVSVKEITKAQNRITARERTSKLAS